MPPGKSLLVVCGLIALALTTPASADWSRVTELPASDVFSLFSKGDTIAAGTDTAVYVSTNGGATWKRSAKPAPTVDTIRAVLVHNGRLYAGTFGQGVFVSNDLGTSWQGYSQGLVGGIGNAVLSIQGLVVRGDSIFAATAGAAAWVRNLSAGSWSLFGASTLQAFSATNMDGGIAVGGSRLFACAGFNGTVFFRDPGQPDWTLSLLFNDQFAPGLAPLNAIWTGHRWVVGSNIGVFHSATGQPPWTFVDLGISPAFFTGSALHGSNVFVSLGGGPASVVARSHDDGVTWPEVETQPSVNIYRIATHGNDLYAARVDGLWRRPIDTVSVPDDPAPARLRFAVRGLSPTRDEVRFALELPRAGAYAIEVFDVRGRRVADPIRGEFAAGPHEVVWNARGLGPGVYLARLTAGTESAVARIVRVR
jgi:hypothetical protein